MGGTVMEAALEPLAVGGAGDALAWADCVGLGVGSPVLVVLDDAAPVCVSVPVAVDEVVPVALLVAVELLE